MTSNFLAYSWEKGADSDYTKYIIQSHVVRENIGRFGPRPGFLHVKCPSTHLSIHHFKQAVLEAFK